jgi:hypothetical protein
MDSRGCKLPAEGNHYVEEDHLASKRCGIYSRGFLSLRENREFQFQITLSDIDAALFPTAITTDAINNLPDRPSNRAPTGLSLNGMYIVVGS